MSIGHSNCSDQLSDTVAEVQVLLHDIRKLQKPLHRFAHHSDEVLQVS